jgi:hypothetical protein
MKIENLQYKCTGVGFAEEADSTSCIIRHFLTNFVAHCFTFVLHRYGNIQGSDSTTSKKG